MIHSDPAMYGRIMETAKSGDTAQEYGIGMALHTDGAPVRTMARHKATDKT